MLYAPTATLERPLPTSTAKEVPAEALDRGPPQRVLIVADGFLLAYRALRTAADLGADVYVLGSPRAAGLARSRFCGRFLPSGVDIDGEFNSGLADAINRATRAHGIDLIIAGDAPATRSVIAIRDLLEAPCFPMPGLETFDRLNDKARFKQVCEELAVPHPPTVTCHDGRDLKAVVRSAGLKFPIIIKPVDRSGGEGIVRLLSEHDVESLTEVPGERFVVQEFIDGEDMGACVYCEDGTIRSFFGQSYHDGIYRTFRDDGLRAHVEKLVSALALSGIFNFDIIRRPDGRPVFLECNPRVYFKIMMSMFAGVNMFAHGKPWRRDWERDAEFIPREVVMPRGLLLAPWRFNVSAARAVSALVGDPVPYFRERLRLET